MPVPTEPYLSGKDATITINSIVLAITDGSYDKECGMDETTNTKDAGFYSSTPTVKKWSGNLTAVCEAATPPTLVEGGYYSATLANPGVESITGNVHIPKITMQTITPKGAAKYQFTFESSGTYTVTPVTP